MCMDGVSLSLMNDETFREILADPALDFVHKQVLMTLYSLDHEKRLADYRKMLPIYLSSDWAKCEAILQTLEVAGLITRSHDGSLALTHPVHVDQPDAACGCGGL
jgi:hypothetical protein